MNKKIITSSLVLGLAVLLSACTPTSMKNDERVKIETNTEVGMEQGGAVESPTPTVTKDDSVDSIEADLKSTTILEEDFSDIK